MISANLIGGRGILLSDILRYPLNCIKSDIGGQDGSKMIKIRGMSFVDAPLDFSALLALLDLQI